MFGYMKRIIASKYLWIIPSLSLLALILFFAAQRFFLTSQSIALPPSANQGNARENQIEREIPKEITLETFFDDIEESGKEKTTIVATGDVIPARSVNRIMRQKKNFRYPFEATADVLRSADITLINLESPLIDDCHTTDAGMIFCGDPQFIEGLQFAGVDVASLANNHSTNYGKNGVEYTTKLLGDNGIIPIGLGRVEYKTHNGVRFAFLAYNGISPLDESIANIDSKRIQQDIGEAKRNSDVMIVSYHWGKEYERYPKTDGEVAPFDPVTIAHVTIDAGADIVVGNHPHWYQGIELYRGKVIFYALGNFIFDQFWSEETQQGYIAKLIFEKKKLVDIVLLPVYIKNTQPYFVEGDQKSAFLAKIKEASMMLIQK